VAKNDDIGEYYLGTMLETGTGEPQNLPRAVQLEQASAAQGNMLGETELGLMAYKGIGMPPDKTKAALEWKQAAAQGDRRAQDFLSEYGL
jgi:TPR repeat protein